MGQSGKLGKLVATFACQKRISENQNCLQKGIENFPMYSWTVTPVLGRQTCYELTKSLIIHT